MYYFINWRQTPEGKVADLPARGVTCRLVAEPSRHSDYALFACRLPDKYRASARVEPVSHELSELLASAADFPPALAFAREEVKHIEVRGTGKAGRSEAGKDGADTSEGGGDYGSVSRIAFSQRLSGRLEFHLSRQAQSPYFLARRVYRGLTRRRSKKRLTQYQPRIREDVR